VTQPTTPCRIASDLIVNNKDLETNDLSVRVAPNPSRTEFSLTIQSSKRESLQLRVLDMYGKQVHTTKGAANQTYRFGAGFSPGMYVVEIMQGYKVKTLKVIKSE
jgi:hypothetical protein